MIIGLTSRTLAPLLLMAFMMLSSVISARAETAFVAVAANFIDTAKALAVPFEEQTGHALKISSGSTGQLYAQIKHGAPFDVFLSADEESPRKLVDDQLASAESRFTYAVGQLVIWCPSIKIDPPDDGWVQLIATVSMAIANPKLAPYGRAAKQALIKRGVWTASKPRIVYGQNIAQTFAMVGTGNAKCGYVARSQLVGKNKEGLGLVAPIDSNDHDPIRQDAVLLKRAENNRAALAFLNYLKSPAARKVITSFGYLEGDT